MDKKPYDKGRIKSGLHWLVAGFVVPMGGIAVTYHLNKDADPQVLEDSLAGVVEASKWISAFTSTVGLIKITTSGNLSQYLKDQAMIFEEAVYSSRIFRSFEKCVLRRFYNEEQRRLFDFYDKQ